MSLILTSSYDKSCDFADFSTESMQLNSSKDKFSDMKSQIKENIENVVAKGVETILLAGEEYYTDSILCERKITLLKNCGTLMSNLEAFNKQSEHPPFKEEVEKVHRFIIKVLGFPTEVKKDLKLAIDYLSFALSKMIHAQSSQELEILSEGIMKISTTYLNREQPSNLAVLADKAHRLLGSCIKQYFLTKNKLEKQEKIKVANFLKGLDCYNNNLPEKKEVAS